MSGMTDDRKAQLLEWFGGDREALQFLLDISQVTELWDDIIDRDTITATQVNAAFWRALVTLPTNPFFQRNMAYLMPLIIQSINSWHDANELAEGTYNERAVAYTIRNMDIQIAQAIVYITQGYDRMREVSPAMWRLFAAEQDDFTVWVGEPNELR